MRNQEETAHVYVKTIDLGLDLLSRVVSICICYTFLPAHFPVITSEGLRSPSWLGWPLGNISVTYYHGYVSLVVSNSQSSPHSWFIPGFVTRLTRRMQLMERELLTLSDYLSTPPIFSGVRVTRSLVFCVCFVDHCLAIVLSVLVRYTDLDFPFGIFKLLFHKKLYNYSLIASFWYFLSTESELYYNYISKSARRAIFLWVHVCKGKQWILGMHLLTLERKTFALIEL